MTARAQLLPPNVVEHFYRGGPAIGALRGVATGDHTPEEWIASTTTMRGDDSRGLSRLADGTLVREAIAADPAGWLGDGHVERFGADPALLVKLLDAGERLPVHVHPGDAFAGEHLGLRFGKTEAWIVIAAQPGARVHVGFGADVERAQLEAWVAAQDRDAMLGALVPVDVTAGTALYVPAGTPHAIGEGILIVELQQPADLSVLLEWRGFGIEDEREASLGLGWDIALSCVSLGACDVAALVGAVASGTESELLPAAASAFFSAQRIAPAGAEVTLRQGFAVVVVTAGAGSIAGLDVVAGDALVVPHAAGRVVAAGELVAIACRPPA